MNRARFLQRLRERRERQVDGLPGGVPVDDVAAGRHANPRGPVAVGRDVQEVGPLPVEAVGDRVGAVGDQLRCVEDVQRGLVAEEESELALELVIERVELRIADRGSRGDVADAAHGS